MQCSSCHQPIPDGSRFCNICGATQSVAPPEVRAGLGKVVSEMAAEIFKLRADIEVLHALITHMYAKLMELTNLEAARIFKEARDEGRERHLEEYRKMIERITDPTA